MITKNSPIGIFDSGLGGLTVLKAVRRMMPSENLVYFGDTARVPYGTKSKEAVIAFSKEIAAMLSARGVKLIIVACNTASSLALEEVRGISKAPVIGVIEPGARAAAAGNGRILVTGTSATVESAAYSKALKKLDPRIFVKERACPLLVPLVEEGWCAKRATKLIVSEYLSPYKNKGFDAVILGCTHYPLLKKVISSVLGGKVRLIDSAETTAAAAKAVLASRGLLRTRGRGSIRFIASDAPEKFSMLAMRLLGIRTGRVEVRRF